MTIVIRHIKNGRRYLQHTGRRNNEARPMLHLHCFVVIFLMFAPWLLFSHILNILAYRITVTTFSQGLVRKKTSPLPTSSVWGSSCSFETERHPRSRLAPRRSRRRRDAPPRRAPPGGRPPPPPPRRRTLAPRVRLGGRPQGARPFTPTLDPNIPSLGWIRRGAAPRRI